MRHAELVGIGHGHVVKGRIVLKRVGRGFASSPQRPQRKIEFSSGDIETPLGDQIHEPGDRIRIILRPRSLDEFDGRKIAGAHLLDLKLAAAARPPGTCHLVAVHLEHGKCRVHAADEEATHLAADDLGGDFRESLHQLAGIGGGIAEGVDGGDQLHIRRHALLLHGHGLVLPGAGNDVRRHLVDPGGQDEVPLGHPAGGHVDNVLLRFEVQMGGDQRLSSGRDAGEKVGAVAFGGSRPWSPLDGYGGVP